MRVLAIDTALNVVSACVWDGESGQTIAQESRPVERGHDEHLLPAIQRVLEASEGGLDGIDRIAVTTGPGSFTGIRIGIAAARAIAMVRNTPVVGVPTLIAYAAPFIGKGDATVAAMIDARHGQVYVQVFSSVGKCIVEPRTTTIAAAVRLLGSGAVFLTGNAAPVAAIEAWSCGMKAEIGGEPSCPDISYVARLGMLADPAQSVPVPVYMNAGTFKTAANSAIPRAVDAPRALS